MKPRENLMSDSKGIVIFGDSSFSQVAYEYFTHDAMRNVVGFTVTKDYMKRDSLFGLPIIPFEEVKEYFDPRLYSMFIAVGYANFNTIRTKFLLSAINKGYKTETYISSNAFVWDHKRGNIGRNCFIFEDNVIQPFTKIGNNNIIWSGNHIGHHSRINENNFISSHVVISGHCRIGSNNFIGVNSTISNNIRIGNRCIIGAGAIVLKDVPSNSKVVGVWV